MNLPNASYRMVKLSLEGSFGFQFLFIGCHDISNGNVGMMTHKVSPANKKYYICILEHTVAIDDHLIILFQCIMASKNQRTERCSTQHDTPEVLKSLCCFRYQDILCLLHLLSFDGNTCFYLSRILALVTRIACGLDCTTSMSQITHCHINQLVANVI